MFAAAGADLIGAGGQLLGRDECEFEGVREPTHKSRIVMDM